MKSGVCFPNCSLEVYERLLCLFVPVSSEIGRALYRITCQFRLRFPIATVAIKKSLKHSLWLGDAPLLGFCITICCKLPRVNAEKVFGGFGFFLARKTLICQSSVSALFLILRIIYIENCGYYGCWRYRCLENEEE